MRRQRRKTGHPKNATRTPGLRAAALAALAGLLAGLGTLIAGTPDVIEDTVLEQQFNVRGAQPEDRVVVIGIDEETQNAISERYPYPRRLHAQAIDRLRQAGTRQIVYDIVFDQPTTVRDDNALIEAVDRAPRIVLGADAVDPQTGEVRVLGGRAVLDELGAGVGSTQIDVRAGNVVRDLPHDVLGLDTLAVAAVSQLEQTVPADGFSDNRALIDWAGPPGTIPTYSFSDLIAGRVDPDDLKGKIVVVGATAPGLGDRFLSTAADRDRLMAGPELQANAIRTTLDQLPLQRAPGWASLLLVALAATMPVALGAKRLRAAVLLAATTVMGVAVLAQVLFGNGVLLDPFPVGVAALGSATAITVTRMWYLQRLRLRFAQSDPEVVDRVLRDPGALGPAGIIGGYRIISQLGRGGMGVVYRAAQERLGREVAIKVIDPRNATAPDTRARFVRETRAAAAVEHPNVIPVYEAGEDHGVLFLAMRLVHGHNLAVHLAQHGPLSPHEAVELLRGLCEGAHAAHQHGIVHRDIKPANILLDTQTGRPHPYLTDFGLAVIATDPRLTVEHTTMGTYDYLAPEQADGKDTGPAADIYALGCVLHELLTGQVPYPRETPAAKLWAHATAPTPSQLPRGVPPAFVGVIAHALAKNPAERFTTALDLADAAHAALGSAAPSTRPQPLRPSSTAGLEDDDKETIIR